MEVKKMHVEESIRYCEDGPFKGRKFHAYFVDWPGELVELSEATEDEYKKVIYMCDRHENDMTILKHIRNNCPLCGSSVFCTTSKELCCNRCGCENYKHSYKPLQ